MPKPNEQALFGKHLKFFLTSTMFFSLAITQTCARQIFSAFDKQKMSLKLDKNNVLVKQCLSCWSNVQACLTSKIQNVCKEMLKAPAKRTSIEHIRVVSKLTNIVLDRQNFKCLPNNACSFGSGLKNVVLNVQ